LRGGQSFQYIPALSVLVYENQGLAVRQRLGIQECLDHHWRRPIVDCIARFPFSDAFSIFVGFVDIDVELC
jgi:hypothetical protein